MIIKALAKEGEITPRIQYTINKFEFCETFKCLPRDIDKMSPIDYLSFLSIMKGKQKAIEENSKNIKTP